MDYSRLRTRPGKEYRLVCDLEMKPGLDKQTRASQPKSLARVFLETVLQFKWAHKVNVKVRIQVKGAGTALAEDDCEFPIILSSSDGVIGLCACETRARPTELHPQPRREEYRVGYLFSHS